MDRTEQIFGNEMPVRVIRRAEQNKEKYRRKYGDAEQFHLAAKPAPAIGERLGVQQLVMSETPAVQFDDRSIIIGNIRMGFGHYRIAMAMASAAHALGYTPYWFDLHAFSDAAPGRIIGEQNQLYSLGSRLSQAVPPFNKLVWEPLNSEGFRRLSYNSSDQKTAELMTGAYADLPKDIPFLATHVWPAQAAIHAGLTRVVNAVPDNWPMALHLAEGALHTVQTPSAALGYRALRGMNGKRPLKPMPAGSVVCTGHYVDHELVANIESDCALRLERMQHGKAKRWLLSIGGAGAQKGLFITVIRKLLPFIQKEKAALFVNVGDHLGIWQEMAAAVPEMKPHLHEHFADFYEAARFCDDAYYGDVKGIHAFSHADVFAAVYVTNLLMRVSDVLLTKPGELSFYPVPKLMLPRVGGHEAWGAIRAAEVGDGTYECRTPAEVIQLLQLMQRHDDVLAEMCANIQAAKQAGIYDGAYRAVRLTVGEKA